MTAIVESIKIARPPEDVFAYGTDFSHFPDWQGGVLSARPEGDAPPAVGSRALVTRQAGARRMSRSEEITEVSPPRSRTVRGVGGRLIAIAKSTIEALDDGERSRVTIALDFEGHGIAKLLVPLLRRQALKQLPENERKLKRTARGRRLARNTAPYARMRACPRRAAHARCGRGAAVPTGAELTPPPACYRHSRDAVEHANSLPLLLTSGRRPGDGAAPTRSPN